MDEFPLSADECREILRTEPEAAFQASIEAVLSLPYRPFTVNTTDTIWEIASLTEMKFRRVDTAKEASNANNE